MRNGKDLQPLFTRVGNKTPIIQSILKIIPPHTTYAEPFVGSGAVFFAKKSVDTEILNDIDEDLMELYNLIETLPDDYEEYRKHFPFSEEEYTQSRKDGRNLKTHTKCHSYQALVKKMKDFMSQETDDPVKQFLQKFWTSHLRFGGKPFGKIYRAELITTKLKKMGQFKKKLSGTILRSDDYKDIINDYDSENTFFFLDPPYEDSKGLYKSFAIKFDEMAEILSQVKGKFLLTLNDSPRIREVFGGFQITPLKVLGAGHHFNDGGIGNKLRNEVFITNYALE